MSWDARYGHRDFRWRGTKQGTECRCGEMFYPASDARIDIIAEWRHHVFTVTGLWPEVR